ncbi:DUF1349 domain-containing protein [Pseudomonas retamae]|uniref:DUF1349 domain-containing protein n=1 Tax=Pseudomonas retamae TaxID=702110 RepID=A0ABW7DDM6_9PSED
MFDSCQWLNEPKIWSTDGSELSVTTDENTDFWRGTYYGFCRHSGHFFGAKIIGDFTAQIRVKGDFKELYDQAGLMVLIDDQRWIKTGVEVNDEAVVSSSVLTNGLSDWAVSSALTRGNEFWLRITVAHGSVRVQISEDNIVWPLVRLAAFPVAEHYLVGPMCCTPEREGLRLSFSEFSVGPALKKELHDLS